MTQNSGNGNGRGGGKEKFLNQRVVPLGIGPGRSENSLYLLDVNHLGLPKKIPSCPTCSSNDHSYETSNFSRKAQAHAREKLRELTSSRRCFQRASAVIDQVNAFTRGWGNYFSLGYPQMAYREVNRFAVQRLTRHLQRRSQRPSRPPAGRTYSAHLQAVGLQPLVSSRRRLAVHACDE